MKEDLPMITLAGSQFISAMETFKIAEEPPSVPLGAF